MRYRPIDNQLFVYNRERFANHLLPGSLAIFIANDIMPTNADGTYSFVQNSDLFYLSGIDQEETILVMFPDHPDEKFREILFVRETNEEIAIWEGHKLTKDEATEISGIKPVVWSKQFEKIFPALMAEAEYVYLNSNEHLRATREVPTKEERFITSCRQSYPLHHYKRAAPVMQQIRTYKSEEEIQLIQQACDITEKGFRRILNMVKPGIMEFEIEAEYLHEFIRNRSRGFAYEPIVGSGGNACILHYVANNDTCKDGDILFMDVGAEYANYNADMSRAVPVNGKFTKRQKSVYNAVLHVQRKAMQLLKSGNTLKEYHKEVGKIMEDQLIQLGLLDKTEVKNQEPENPLYKKYFMHGTSHFLGLDVHDVGNFYHPVQPGMVFTVDPGIYIREENLGIRLENNVVITENGIRDLMENIPIEPEEIEDLMHSGGSH